MTFDAKESSVRDGSPVELFRFSSGTRVWLYTSSDTEVAFLSETYAPEAISRGQVEQNIEREAGRLEVELPRTNPVAALFVPYLPTTPMALRVYRLHRGEPEYAVGFMGAVASAACQGSTVRLTCLPVSESFRRKIPTCSFQSQCNWALYSGPCGAGKESKGVGVALSLVDRTELQGAGFGSYPSGYFTNGWVERSDGDKRWVTVHAGATATILNPFPDDLRAGEAVIAYPGCDRTLADCGAKFSRLASHCGFAFLPDKNPFDGGVG